VVTLETGRPQPAFASLDGVVGVRCAGNTAGGGTGASRALPHRAREAIRSAYRRGEDQLLSRGGASGLFVWSLMLKAPKREASEESMLVGEATGACLDASGRHALLALTERGRNPLRLGSHLAYPVAYSQRLDGVKVATVANQGQSPTGRMHRQRVLELVWSGAVRCGRVR
jgi:hypothetical protein